MEMDIKEVDSEKVISIQQARKQGIETCSAIKGNYLGYINNEGMFDFLTYDGNYIAVQNTKCF